MSTYIDNDGDIVISCDSSIYADATTVSTISLNPSDISITGNLCISGSTYNVTQPIFTEHPDHGSVVIGKSENDKQKVYICEKWQSKNPIDLGDGLYASLPEDMLSDKELRKKVYNKIEDLYPDKAIKLGLNEENITLRRKTVTIEIDVEGD